MGLDLKKLDIYRKVPQDLTEPTLTGALISIVCVVLIFFLLITEFLHFTSPEIISELYVETGTTQQRIPVILNISLPNLHCDVTGLDIQDSNGRHEVGFVKDTVKTPINGGLGCRMETHFEIARVPGNFHVSTHSAKNQPEKVDMAHHIHTLKFGDSIDSTAVASVESSISLSSEGLNEQDHSVSKNSKHPEAHEYHMKIVPSIYENGSHERKVFYQYTYGYKPHPVITPFGVGVPAIWFRYDLNPITIKYKPRDKHWYSFITLMFSLIGGTFTVVGILNSIIFTTSKFFKKIQLGKLN